MTHRKLTAAALAGLFILPGCVEPIGRDTGSVLNWANKPNYVATHSRGTVPRHCLKATRGGFGTLPPGCMSRSAFADQVANPSELLNPQSVGDGSIRETITSTSVYLQGDPTTTLPTDEPAAE